MAEDRLSRSVPDLRSQEQKSDDTRRRFLLDAARYRAEVGNAMFMGESSWPIEREERLWTSAPASYRIESTVTIPGAGIS